jgi:hypothetical protein
MSRSEWMDRLKKAAKWIIRPEERKKVNREGRVKRQQDRLIRGGFPKSAKKIIIFFLDGADLLTGRETVSGGLLSIHSLFEETLAIKEVHGAETLLCTMKGANLFFEFSSFHSPHRVFRYRQLETWFRGAEEIIIHLPEYLVEDFLARFDHGQLDYLASRRLHINILNQNIRLMPPMDTVDRLRKYGVRLTQTTAHERYATEKYRQVYGIPLHHFSTFIAPERYTFLSYGRKKNRIAFSPDNPERNAIVAERLEKELPAYEIVVIGGMTYEQFKEFIAETKFTFTFGEGLDGYYCETVLTGGICMAVYNEEFFTADFQTLETVHTNFEQLVNGCVEQIKRLDKRPDFEAYNRRQFDLLTHHYKFSKYQDNIRRFYLGEYTFP